MPEQPFGFECGCYRKNRGSCCWKGPLNVELTHSRLYKLAEYWRMDACFPLMYLKNLTTKIQKGRLTDRQTDRQRHLSPNMSSARVWGHTGL